MSDILCQAKWCPHRKATRHLCDECFIFGGHNLTNSFVEKYASMNNRMVKCAMEYGRAQAFKDAIKDTCDPKIIVFLRHQLEKIAKEQEGGFDEKSASSKPK